MLKLVKDMSIKFIVDELNRFHQRISALEVEISELKLKEQLYQENVAIISKKNLYQNIINSISQAVNNTIDPGDLTEYTVDILNKNILRINSAAIYFIVKDLAVLSAQRGYSEDYLENLKKIPQTKGLTWKSLEENKSIYKADTENEENILRLGKQMGVKSYIATPILFNYKQIGTLTINSLFSNAFGDEEVNLLNSLVNQIAISIYNIKFNGVEDINYSTIS